MIDRELRFAGAALVAIVGIWAGVRIRSARLAPVTEGRIAIPVGEASPPSSGDFIDGPDPAMPTPAKIPDRLPEFSLAALDGKLTSVKSWDGRSLVINFWATWCAPCRREIPLLRDLAGQWGSRGVTVIGIAVDHREQVSSFAREFMIDYPVLVGEQDALDVAGAFGVDSPVFPFTVFTDRRGEVVALYVGELQQAQANLILSAVQNLNQEHIALEQARRTIKDGLRALSTSKPG